MGMTHTRVFSDAEVAYAAVAVDLGQASPTRAAAICIPPCLLCPLKTTDMGINKVD